MLRIMICDDSAAYAAFLRTNIRTALRETQAALSTYTAAEDIPESVLQSCDIAFLDIDFAGKDYTGLDIAAKLRSQRPGAVIIFVTNYIEYAPEGYEVGAFRYLLKSETERKLPLYLSQSLEQMASGREVLTIQVNGELTDIPLSEILYIESDQHMVIVHTARRDHAYYSTLSELEEKLADRGFLRIHKSYLVNMAHLKKYQSQQAVLSDGTVLRVSARSYGAQKEKYLLWKGRQG